MNKNLLKVLGMIMLVAIFPTLVLAENAQNVENDLIGAEQSEFEQLVVEIQNIQAEHPEYTEEMTQNILDEHHRGTYIEKY